MANDTAVGFTFNGYNSSNARTSVTVRDGHFSMTMRGQTNGTDMRGFGVFEGEVSGSNHSQIALLKKAACTLKGPFRAHPGNNLFLNLDTQCPDGRVFGGDELDIVSMGEVGEQLIGPVDQLVKSFYSAGNVIEKLDVTADVTPQHGKLLVTLKFANTGHSEITFESPSTWEGTYNPLAENSQAYVSAGPQDAGFDMDLGGREMINKGDYPEDIVRIAPGHFRYAKFSVYPNNRIKAGRYEVGGGSTIKQVLAPKELAGRIDFLFQSKTVEFAGDYPANQKELGEFEVYRRAKLFDQIHGIGDTVAESGYYRAFGEKGERDDFPQRLLKGDKYPARQVENQTRNGRTTLGPAVLWRWEAYPDAQMTARSEERCPRSGLWLATIPSYGLSEYMTHLLHTTQYAHSVEADDRIPSLGLGDREREAQVVWTWLGPKNA
ncbi:hypothetical protein [Caballeronia sp. SBC2]|uniref:hypothetical protein n=1 Tax=Caballeronia sp. SBC2 TaxID=2705547 RepID=UPI0013E11DC0|nr:hypothetical protein [Caballeronia sp. SBC2]QIE22385.1 hypothetical protein SBC2_03950 [Caballeronia sp. SBC2]